MKCRTKILAALVAYWRLCLGGCSLLLVLSSFCHADSNASVAGLVTDSAGREVAGVAVAFTNLHSGIVYQTQTNGSGIYRLSGLLPGVYRANLMKEGFGGIVKGGIELHVQDEVSINFALRAGSVYENFTVEEGAPPVNTDTAAVSTVIDRQFAENLPSNGRGFETLIDLTPGAVITPSSRTDAGQFSVNGQHSNANYWTVDGVGVNVGTTTRNVFGDGLAGGLPLFSVQGGTNSLVSLDAMREFRIEMSTSAAEFGRTPGAQISIVTRSGTSRFHGSLFNYLRNDALDARDWFASRAGLPKPEERQNDFGGTFSGPLSGHTFFFFSYEALRLRLPQTALSFVPDTAAVVGGLSSRETAAPAIRPYLAAFPLPNGPELFSACKPVSGSSCPPSGLQPSGAATFNAAFSDRSKLDDYSIRIDHALTGGFNLFGRYNNSPSELFRREPNALSSVFRSRIRAQTTTFGGTWSKSPAISNDIRFNFSVVNALSFSNLDNFGGAVPFALLPGTPLANKNASQLTLQVFAPTSIFLVEGKNQRNQQRQLNVVDDLTMQLGRHSWKFGIDWRRLTPLMDPPGYTQFVTFNDIPSLAAGSLFNGTVETQLTSRLLFQNFGLFAQDQWKVVPGLTLTYGVRWELDLAPTSLQGPSFVAVTGFDRNNLSNLSLAPAGTPPFRTTYTNFAPRLGIAYQVSQRHNFQSIIRGGLGVYYDLATHEIGNSLSSGSYPFGASKSFSEIPFPLNDAAATPPSINVSDLDGLSAFDPNLRLPFTSEWNLAFEQALGNQTLTATYVGAVGRRLIQTAFVSNPTSTIDSASLMFNSATSDYHGLQFQFKRRMIKGVQALASYTWSHSIDSDSSGSSFSNSDRIIVPNVPIVADRGASDFDIRHSLSSGFIYTTPPREQNTLLNALLREWSFQGVLQVRSAPPVNVYIPSLSEVLDSVQSEVRPDVVQGIPFYHGGPGYPGGLAFNSFGGFASCPDGSTSVGPFCPPPLDYRGFPLRQGNLPRNGLRAFGASQFDFAVHREFRLHDSLALQFRAELFNLFNHPNFGPPSPLLTFNPVIGFPQFGQSTQMLAQSLSGGNLAGGGLDPLYQFGGPRSIQFALKMSF